MIPLGDEIAAQKERGILLVLTGPTAAGKDTVFAKLLEDPSTIKIITTTSREKRPNETEGDAYFFVEREKFEEKIGNGDFFEWVEFREHLYGTQKKTLTDALASGKDVVWRIEMKGVKNIKEKIKHMTQRSVFVFLTAPSMEDLERRVQRDENSEHHRWNPALVRWEMSQYDACDYLVINEDDDVDQAVAKVRSIMQSKRCEIISDVEQ